MCGAAELPRWLHLKSHLWSSLYIILCRWLVSIVKPTRRTIFRVYWISLYMFRTVFPSVIRSSRLYIQRQVCVIQVRWRPTSMLASKQSTNLYDTYLTLYVQSWTPDDGRKDRPKHVEWYSVNSENCASSWFCYRNISWCMIPWTSKGD
jgi:hypothetical protein